MSLTLSLAGSEDRGRAELESCIGGGGVAVFPADTVYGLACDPLDPAAVERLGRLKGRGEGRPAAVMFFSRATMTAALPELGPRTSVAVERLLPGPFTLILPNALHHFPLACGPDPSRLGVRLIEGALADAGCAVLQSSANPTGAPDARALDEVDPAILAGADLILDGGRLPGTPSTVVDLNDFEATWRWVVLREGAVPRHEVRSRLEGIEA